MLVALSSHKDNVARNRSIVAASWIATRNEEARIFFHNNNVGWNSLKAAYDNLDDSNTIRAACQLIRALVAKDDPQADNPKVRDISLTKQTKLQAAETMSISIVTGF